MARLTSTENRYFNSFSIMNLHQDFIKQSNLNRRRLTKAKMYTDIITTLFRKIFNEVVSEGYEFKFRGLGKFICVKYLPKTKIIKGNKVYTNKPVNLHETFKLRRETGNPKLWVFFDNKESGGYTYKLLWDKTETAFINQSLYVLKLTKVLKQEIFNRVSNGTILARTIDIKI